MIRGLYRLLTEISGPALPWWLRWRARRTKEDPARIAERYGIASRGRPAGPLLWLHAASIGESLSVLPLLEALVRDGWSALVTTGTTTSAALLAERLPPQATHQYLPLDRPSWIRRFLDHWRPDMVVWTESELWPNTLAAIAARGLPAALINGRLSDRAVAGWRRWPEFARSTLAAFRLVLAQSPEDARRFAELGATAVNSVGNLKLAVPDLPFDRPAFEAMQGAVGARPVWLAASIHPGEDTIVGRVHRTLKGGHSALLTIVVPRHAGRGAEIAATLSGRACILRSSGQLPGAGTEIYIADTMGELGLFYRLCPIVFMGKTFAVGGGQNPAEAAQLGCALVFGPDMSNFRDMTAGLMEAGAAEQVTTELALSAAVARLLDDPADRRRRGDAARGYMAVHATALQETLAQLAPILDAAKAAGQNSHGHPLQP